ncbi:MAG TPA: hypothetical protein VJX92_16660 [Methylomirabilota bacterium]|nr:hypothetical protein [Methylomirabilota bacterium]
MNRGRRGSKALVALVALWLCLGAAPAMAHPTKGHLLDVHAREAQAMGHVERPEPSPGASIGWPLVAGLAALLGAGALASPARRPRGRVIAVGLVLVLGVFALESGVHSVHHLADPEAQGTCPVLSGSHHLSWGEVEAVADSGVPLLCESGAPPIRLAAAPRWSIHRPHQGRAPPA